MWMMRSVGPAAASESFGPTRQNAYHAHAWAPGGCRGLLAFREVRHQLANALI